MRRCQSFSPGSRQTFLMPRIMVGALLWLLAASAFASDNFIGGTASPSWSVGGNWSTGAIPVSSDNVFMVGPGQASTNKTDIGFYLHTVQFPSGAPVFRIQVTSAIHVGDSFGGGVINDSGYAQFFDVQAKHVLGDWLLIDGGTIGTGVQIINYGSTITGDDPHSGGNTDFNGNASAGQAVIYNYAAEASSAPGRTEFYSQSSAGTALITNVGGDFGGGTTYFWYSSTAAGAAIINEAGTSSGGNGGSTFFSDSSAVANARIANNGAGFASNFYGGGQTIVEGASIGSAIITNHGGTVANAYGGFTQIDVATVGTATITNEAGASGAFGGETRFVVQGASAGSATISNNGGGGSGANGGHTNFYNGAAAGTATINNNAAQYSPAFSGQTTFSGGSAGSAKMTNNGSNLSFASAAQQAGATVFQSNGTFNATAATALITNNGGTASFNSAGGQTIFSDSSTAGSATLIANPGVPGYNSGRIFIPGGQGGAIVFNGTSTGGKARVEVFGNGYLDLSPHSLPGLAIGSIEGTGYVSLGSNNLSVGSNNRSTTFSGVIYDASANGGTGSLTKTGSGRLTVSGANTYTGTTTITKGTLNTKNTSGSATGSGPVQVNGGTFGGTGLISGAVTVGQGNTPGAVLQPGTGTTAGTLTINNALTFNSSSTYKCVLNRKTTSVASRVSALGVSIQPNVTFTFVETGTAALAKGTVFTIINNTAAYPISGRFSNLAGGSTFTDAHGTTFKANYSGGTGNDLILTVQ